MLSFSATQRTCSPQNTPDIRTHTNQAGDGARIDRRGHRTVAVPERLWAPAPGEKSHTTLAPSRPGMIMDALRRRGGPGISANFDWLLLTSLGAVRIHAQAVKAL